MRHALELAAFLVLSAPLALLPRGAALRLGSALGFLAYYLWGSRRRIALQNLRAAIERKALNTALVPERVIRENFMNMGRWLAEVARVYFGFGGPIVEAVRVKGLEHYERARAGGRGVMFFTGHCGNWELLTIALSSKVAPFCGVARKQSNPFVDRFIVRARRRHGSDIIYKQGALRKFISVLKAGGNAGVVVDQAVLPDEGVLVDFLGAPAWTMKMPVTVARRTGAALLPVFLRMDEKGHEIVLHPEVELSGDEAEDTRRLCSYVEDFIRENPSQWLWIHRRWKRTGPEHPERHGVRTA